MKKKNKKIFYFSILFICILSVLLMILLKNTFSRKDYYIVKSRVTNMKNIRAMENYGAGSSVVGWLQIQGTDIDYPLIYNTSWTYPVEAKNYAKMTYYTSGFHNHFEISGHNIFNLSSKPRLRAEEFDKFEELMSFVYYDFAKENKYIQLTYEGEEYVYKIFAVGFIPLETAKQYRTIVDFNDDQFDSYLKMLAEYNIYKYDVNVSKDDKLLSLSTCTRFFGNNDDWRFYVIGRLLRENEKINNYGMKTSRFYSKIEKILKGDEYNDEI